LGGSLFARDVDDAPALTAECGEGLEQNGRFTDAGVAADEDGGAGNEAAAEHAVEFGDAGQDARRLGFFGLERDEFEAAAFA